MIPAFAGMTMEGAGWKSSRAFTFCPAAGAVITYDALRAGFRWAIPARFNIGVDCCDKWADDSGRLAPVQESPSQVRIRVLDYDQPHRAHCLSIKGWAARSVEMSGAVIEAIEEDKCRLWGDSTCEMWLRWR